MKRLLLLSLLVLGAAAPAAGNNNRPDIVGTWLGSYRTSTLGAAWVDLTSDDFLSATGAAALTDGRTFTHLLVVNTHATNSIFVMFAAGAGATTQRIEVRAGAVLGIDCYGLSATTVSVQGSGANTSGMLVAQFVQAGT